MENYLYLLEIFVETITFSSIIGAAKANEVIVSGEVGKFMKMDIFSMSQEDNHVDKQIDLNCGRSNLFSCSNDELLKKLMQYPLILTVTVRNSLKGRVLIKWDQRFLDLIHHSPESFGVTGPVAMQDQYMLKEKDTDAIMGDIKAIIRLSSFGSSIQTSYQLVQATKGTTKKYLIRGARGETTFECQRLNGSSSDMMPVSPLFTTSAVKSRSTEVAPKYEDERVSWMALYKSTLDPKFSMSPDDFSITISNVFHPIKTPSSLTFDIVSIMERPEERKFIDLRIRRGSGGFIFELDDKTLKETDFSKESLAEDDDEEDIGFTNKNITKMLCKNKDCPAVRKFKEFGLGPLAKTKGLGTLRGDDLPPTTYGISQTYGIFDQYGPYGLFSRPKNPDNPFVSKKDDNWKALCWKPKRKKEDKTTKSTDNCSHGHYPPLRLTGGGVLDYDDVKSPLHECKEIMDQFDEVLEKYKKAIGPCGKPTCPFAPNVIRETCKKVCQHPDEAFKLNDTIQFTLASPAPERARSSSSVKKHTLKGACGSPKCAYAKYKSSLVDEDAIMELQYLPSATSGRCGHPKCPFPVEQELPPIHWDCPDPLPKGRCKNPECPYLPKEIKCLNAVLAKGPCGNLNCPYSTPDACPSPNCPFGSKDCPYQPQQQKQKTVRGVSSLCENPECPFAVKDTNSLCDNPDCPYADKENNNSLCDNPSCPYASKETDSICDNPNCPYASKETDSICDNPNCPYASKEVDSICDNPECPFAKKTPSPCYLPQKSDICDNPDCPFARKPPCQPPPCYAPPCGMGPCYTPPCGVPPCYTPPCGVPPCYTPPCGVPPCYTPPCGTPNLMSMCANSSNPYLALLAYYLAMSPCNPEYKKICFGGPECPLNKKKETDLQASPDVCQYMPGAKRERPPKSPYTSGQNGDECVNGSPDVCPYTPGGKPGECATSERSQVQKSEGICENPTCPYERQSKGEGDASSVCKSSGSVCGEEAKSKMCYKKPSPCYVPKDDVCENQDCPFPPSSCFPSPCGGLPCSLGMSPLLQAMLTYYLPSICSDLNCPYTVQEVKQFKNILQMLFGDMECPRKQREPSIVEENSVKDDDICGNPACPYRQETASSPRNADQTDDMEMLEGHTEYKTDTRTDVDFAPCTARTCQATGGQLICDVCPCSGGEANERKSRKSANYDENVMTEGATEHKTDVRTDIDLAPCTTRTCQSTGGKLICDVCPCSSGKETEKKFRKKRKQGKKGKRKGKFVYSIGDKYPGVQIGHKECVLPSPNVPKRMGWLWNIQPTCGRLKARRGWRPGAIAKTIAARIRQHREAQGIQMLQVPDYRKGLKGYGEYESAASLHVAPKPTLQIKKRDGCYWITMNPLKDPHTLVENENPYMDCTPMQFKIVKNKEKKDENDEYRSCFCGDEQPPESSSSDSELDIEFTPPAGIIHPERFKKKRNVVHGSTQYLAADFAHKSETTVDKDKKGKKGKGKEKKGKGKGKKGKGKKK